MPAFQLPYMTEWTPRLLLISACNLVRLLFESGVYSRAASISFRAGTEIQVINIVYKHKDSILALLHGISVNIDGSEDGDVHCLKDGGVAEDARVAIDRDTGTLLSGEDRDDSDPFEEEEDEDQLEEIDDC